MTKKKGKEGRREEETLWMFNFLVPPAEM